MGDRTITVTVHLGVIPVHPEDWTTEPLAGFSRASAPYPFYNVTSFREWGEPVDEGFWGEPHEVTIDLEAESWLTDPANAPQVGAKALDRRTLESVSVQARDLVGELLPNGWRLVDYVVITDSEDYSRGARTVGMWGA